MKKTALLLVMAAFALAQDDMVNDPEGRDQARSMVITKFGIVATSQTLASQAGARVLEDGGNAIDAAIAANATLGVVEPAMNGMGGDLFAIIYEAKSGKLYALNSSGWAPAGLTAEMLRAKGITDMNRAGAYRVTVPGAVAGWQALHDKFGTKSFERLLAPAIYYAENGFPVTEIIAWQSSEKAHAKTPGFAETYMPGGHAPKVGEMFRNPALAGSLKLVAEKGRDGFYHGATAEKIVKFLNEHGNPMTLADLAEFQPEWVEPISTTYRGWTVYEIPPNTQGIAALEMLNIMEKYPIGEYGHNSAKALHVMIEAKKLAYADMLRYVGDPRSAKIPVEQLKSKSFAAERAARIDPARANCDPLPAELADRARAGNDTIYLSTIDKDGNIVSLIQSNYSSFGTGMVAPGTGFALQNRGGLFSLKPDEPNTLAPRKRPLHTIIPAFLQRGETRIGFGIMGGFNQAQAHAQYVANIVDFGMNIQAALEAARFTKGSFGGCDVQMESRIPENVRSELTSLGHKITVRGAYSGTMGRGEAVERIETGVNFGASDPRGDGEAIPQGPPLRMRAPGQR
ncbi:MAG TPA: gamma-glutamyltransferase [Bryobacteraceae bacterium]|jgi:gamma-glutamyltranspeptidase/glutathione hydrolase|nr:gamma-glutamyltransferase [Bryobacteraceae bacterium]